jgi:integrase/recombinase XerD
MATLKLTLDTRRTCSGGKYPIIIRLSSRSNNASIPTNIKLLTSEWDSSKAKVTKLHPNHAELNHALKQQLFKLESKLLQLPNYGQDLTVTALKQFLLNTNTTGAVGFLEFATKEIQQLTDQERYGNANAYKVAVNRFIAFAGKDILLDQITYTVISDFDAALLKQGLSRNSIAVYMREIRAILNKAIKKGQLDRNKYPFAGFTIKTVKTISMAITKRELVKLMKHPLPKNSSSWHTRNIFTLIFNLIGISFIDLALLTRESIQGDRIVYRRMKTGKIYSVKITAEARRILTLYSDDSQYLLPQFKLEGVPKQDEIRIIHLRLKTVNKHLKKLGLACGLSIPLTTYVARYSWANVAKQLGYPKDLIAEALGHEYGNRVTGIYLDNYGNEVIDDMNKKVVG